LVVPAVVISWRVIVSDQEADAPLTGLRLDRISTHMTTLQDAERFVLRYGKAIRGYVTAILRDPAEADEVMQELILGLLRRGGPATWPGAGRFRDYLKTSARNAAITFLRKKGRQRASELTPDAHADPDSTDAAADRAMISEWQSCVIDKVKRELDAHERKSPGNLCYTVLKVVEEFPDEDSPRQAAIVAERTRKPITPEAFRKQVSRARRLMAEFILLEVAASMASPTAESVEGELHELGLWGYVRDYLPDDWREQFFSG
jgi:RNA polymerase sigma factor (sigma-70 family)